MLPISLSFTFHPSAIATAIASAAMDPIGSYGSSIKMASKLCALSFDIDQTLAFNSYRFL